MTQKQGLSVQVLRPAEYRRAMTALSLKVRRLFLIVCGIPLMWASGCSSPVTTLNPLYTKEDCVEDDVVCGTWTSSAFNGEVGVAVTKTGAGTYTVSKNRGPVEFRSANLRLLRIGQHYFGDLTIPHPDPQVGDSNEHMFSRIGILGNNIYMRWLDSKAVHELIATNPKALTNRAARDYEEVAASEFWLNEEALKKEGLDWRTYLEGVRAAGRAAKDLPRVITADTAELQAFVRRGLEQPELWGAAMVFTADQDIPVREAGVASKPSRTLTYWLEVWHECARVSHKVPIAGGKNVSIDPVDWERLADSINALPTLGVDLDAVNCARSIARLSAETGDVLSRTTFKAWMAEAIGKSLAGNPVGAVGERIGAVAQREQDIGAKIQQCREQIEDARVLLTDRYGIEFPRMR